MHKTFFYILFKIFYDHKWFYNHKCDINIIHIEKISKMQSEESIKSKNNAKEDWSKTM